MNDPTSVDYHRDQWGRPLIVPPEGGKPIPYIRASSAAKTVEDTYNLEMWARRNVVFGMARDPSLTARVLALGGDPSTWDMDTKKAANAIHEDAAQVALARKAADIGTALHRMTEIADRGEPLIAGPYQADIDAYTGALALGGFEVNRAWIECHLVCDELKMAGTADRLLVRDGQVLVADLKTGETVDYGGLGWAAQLAAYAHGSLYDIDQGIRLPTPLIDRTTGIIIHLPAGKGVCTLYEIDLVAGYRAAQLANEIRDVRREAQRWISPLTATSDAKARHPSNGPRRGPVEGDLIDDARYAKVKARHDELPAAAQFWLASIAAEANKAGASLSLKQQRSERRYWSWVGLIMLAQDDVTEPDFVRALVARAMNDEAALFPTVTVGQAVGAMNAGEAKAFRDEVAALRRGELHCQFDGAAMRLIPVA